MPVGRRGFGARTRLRIRCNGEVLRAVEGQEPCGRTACFRLSVGLRGDWWGLWVFGASWGIEFWSDCDVCAWWVLGWVVCGPDFVGSDGAMRAFLFPLLPLD